MKRCVLICASPDVDVDFCEENISHNDYVVCADGGYDIAKKLGIVPGLVIGDFDSSKEENITAGEVIKLPRSKDDTDTMYCLKEIVKRNFTEVLILGGTGGRLDHTIANLAALKFLYKNNCSAALLDKDNQIIYTESEYIIESKKNSTISIFTFGCEFAAVTLKGFKYIINDYKLMSDIPLGISNICQEDKAVVQVKSGGVLIIINSQCDCGMH